METYKITVFLIILNYVIFGFVSLGIVPIEVPFISSYVSPDTFSANVPASIDYDSVSYGLYLFGDFPRALAMIVKLLVIAPFSLAFLMNALSVPSIVTTLLMIMLFIIYVKDLVEFIGNRLVK